MPRKKTDNKIVEIKPDFGSVLVCNKKQLRPFVEIIIEEPENVSNQNLGKLIGVFEITDISEDSSYVVNYLISVIKKEYFSKAKRGPIESLEAALHKANLALANLAEHKNIGWLGKLNALIAVTEKNNLHLSQAGTASAFLLRSQVLTDVSEGLAPSEAEPYPLKTFVSVSSGRLEENDKLIITTANIFDIFSLEEIKKSALRFSDEEFIQFLRTALGNELERAAVLVADMKAQEKFSPEKSPVQPKQLNAFSRDAFADTPRKNKHQGMEAEIQEEIKESPQEFVDEKTGHIYIKESDGPFPPQTAGIDYSKAISEKMGRLTKTASNLSKNIPRLDLRNIRLPKVNIDTEKMRRGSSQAFKNIHARFKDYKTRIKLPAPKTISVNIPEKAKDSWRKHTVIASDLSKGLPQKIRNIAKIFIPSYARIKKSLGEMRYQQKIYAALALVLILVAPIFIIKLQNSREAEKITSMEENIPAPLPLEGDTKVIRIADPDPILSANNILDILELNEQAYAISGSDIIDIKENRAFPIPDEFKNPAQMIGMDDLNLIFLLNDTNKILSFSPISKKFDANIIDIPSESQIRALGTYLTYIYVADGKNNQIYRYPRSEGGFGEKNDWLKDAFDFSDMTDMAMNENIFISNRSTITKLFRGKTQDFDLENPNTPLNISKIALGESGNIFVLDTQHARVVRFDPENRISAQYYHPDISSVLSFAINEGSGLIYLATEKEIKTIPLNQ